MVGYILPTPADVQADLPDFFHAATFVDFFSAVRKEGEPLEWNFLIITKAADVWTEKSMLIHRGDPAAWNIERDAKALVADVRIEFAERQREQRQ